jgi:hypothetical protein
MTEVLQLVIFVHNVRLSSFSTSPIINCLSDHDAQFLEINNIVAAINIVNLKQRTRKINNHAISTSVKK